MHVCCLRNAAGDTEVYKVEDAGGIAGIDRECSRCICAHAWVLLRQAGESGVRDLQEALLLRNDEYQKLLGRAAGLEADKRELAAQAAGLRQAAQAAQVSAECMHALALF